MATLGSEDLSFDFRFTGFEYGWVQYNCYFNWKNEPLIRNDLLKRRGDYWGSRPDHSLLANEHRGDGFVPFLKKVLETDEADYWEPIEPDIIVAVYPGDYFPFLPSHFTQIYESDELKAKREAREKLKAEQKQLPDDLFTFVAFVDSYNFKEAGSYSGQGLSLQMIVSRQELKGFVKQLEQEYLEFKTAFKVDEYSDDD